MENLPFLLDLFGIFLTLSILSYLLFGNNALFRLVTYLFIGVVAGYITAQIFFTVLVPRLKEMLLSGNLVLMGVGAVLIVLGILVLMKLFPRLSRFGSLPMAILVGIGAAVAVGGAVLGTLSGQIGGTLAMFNVREGGDLLAGGYVLLGAVSALAYFQYSTRSKATAPVTEDVATNPRATALELLAKVGQIFIGITLGAMFAGVYTAAISAMVERLIFLFEAVLRMTGNLP